MTKWVLHPVRKVAYQIVIISSLGAGLISLFILLLQGLNAGLSALSGVAVWMLPNLFFAHKFFSDMRPSMGGHIVKNLFFAEIIKWLLSAILFLGFLKMFSLSLFPFVVGFLSTQILSWIVSLVITERRV